MNLLVASNNLHKIKEMQSILNQSDILLKNGSIIDEKLIIENGQDFKSNAVIKAKLYAKTFNEVAIADDSGLMVDVIGGLPGIYSKRYSGLGDASNNEKLLSVLETAKNRKAKFVCVIAIAFPDGKIFTYEGYLDGRISTKPKGDLGFGYDPIFIPKAQSQTLGQLGATYKDLHSHRKNALHKLLEDQNEVINYWRHTWQK